ncbi:LysR family transcriptional regulator (plasmid) [Sinorhizobium meliloti]|uniref:Transcriptional activator, LysR family,N-terminus protein n=1 Tax=Rhizobium meliloti (strain 1021) TaxID=266834 RepID=Q92UZ9_RHIME|nr:LysR family transcriptional regulator [Sinorhizobium meliloti]CAC49335.1 putative transcriptional activator, LysR family,N-terminus protein [Sinorhizobium meliloti 1021]MDX0369768.1 LysR family transcriptional regulator [Sinorhizobium meliloti]PTD22423.1 LysR family transcriptional regulator [Sinorhizobium meliloti]RVK52320.1 LysR family transcriptional regulator [Sinorhizobium meliloti]
MKDLNDLYYFVQVVDHGGYAAAARANDIQKSELSRRIQQLEERLGVRLLNRSSRRFSVTEIGREYYDRCVAMLVEAEAADQMIAQVRSEPRGIVRVSCPVALINFAADDDGLAPGRIGPTRSRPAGLAPTRRHRPCRFPFAPRAAAFSADTA